MTMHLASWIKNRLRQERIAAAKADAPTPNPPTRVTEDARVNTGRTA